MIREKLELIQYLETTMYDQFCLCVCVCMGCVRVHTHTHGEAREQTWCSSGAIYLIYLVFLSLLLAQVS